MKKNLFKKKQAGITLIEMLVVIFIFVLVAGVLMFNYSSFQTNVSVRNLAQDIALAIRKGQTYATSVRIADTGTFSTDAFSGYGVSFSTDSSLNFNKKYSVYNKQFILFADSPLGNTNKGDRLYQGGNVCGTPTPTEECIEANTITTADKIVQLCYQIDSQPTLCNAKTINIIFRRPVPDADICVDTGTGGCRIEKISNASIVLESAQKQQKTISIWNTGQISVK